MRAPYSRTLFDLVCEQADRYGDALALVAGNVRLTYKELEVRARRVGAALHRAGMRRGERIGMLVNNRAEWVEVCIGAAAVGAVPVPFSTWSKRREIDFLLADSAVRLLVALERFGDHDYAADLNGLLAQRPERYPRLDKVVLIGNASLLGAQDYDTFLAGTPQSFDVPPPGECAGAQDIAFILYTSGSSAYPKAVPLAHGDSIENGFNIGERQGLKPGERVLLPLPLFWSYGSANAMCAALTHGAALVLQSRFEAGEALDIIERERIDLLYTMPALTTALVTHPSFRRERTRSLRCAMTIGTPQDVTSVAEVLGAGEVCNVYGQTESYGNCAVTWHHWPLERRRTVQGPPLPGVTVRIVDPESGEPLPQGAVGAIEVKGKLTPGYDGASSEQNAKTFTADGFFRSGDLGRLTADGDVQFVARDSEMIKRAGINIGPAEIEEVLQQHPAVAAVGVAGAPDPTRGEIIVAFVVPAPGAKVTAEELRTHCRTLAATYKTPDRIEFCQVLPLTTTGKIMRRELKQMAASVAEREKVG